MLDAYRKQQILPVVSDLHYKKIIHDELTITAKICSDISGPMHFDSTNAQLSPSSSHSSHHSLQDSLTALKVRPITHDPKQLQLMQMSPSDDAELMVEDDTLQSERLLPPRKSLDPKNRIVVEDVTDVSDEPAETEIYDGPVIDMFPDANDSELQNNGHNILTFPPPYLKHNPRAHLKLPDDTMFTNGFLQRQEKSSMWQFFPSRQAMPLRLR